MQREKTKQDSLQAQRESHDREMLNYHMTMNITGKCECTHQKIQLLVSYYWPEEPLKGINTATGMTV